MRWLDWYQQSSEERNRTGMLSRFGGMSIYGGTVPEATIAKRRRKNKAARKARRLNRG